MSVAGDGLGGGGGNFGVVTAIEIRLVPGAEVDAGQLFWPIERAAEVLPAAVDWTRTLPDTATTSLKLLRLPPSETVPEPLRGRAFVAVLASAIGTEEAGEGATSRRRARPRSKWSG